MLMKKCFVSYFNLDCKDKLEEMKVQSYRFANFIIVRPSLLLLDGEELQDLIASPDRT